MIFFLKLRTKDICTPSVWYYFFMTFDIVEFKMLEPICFILFFTTYIFCSLFNFKQILEKLHTFRLEKEPIGRKQIFGFKITPDEIKNIYCKKILSKIHTKTVRVEIEFGTYIEK